MTFGIVGLLLLWAVLGGWMFTFALEIQNGLGGSALRSGLTYAPAAVAFAVVSLTWRRLPSRWHPLLTVSGLIFMGLCLVLAALLLQDGGDGGAGLYLIGMGSGAGM